MAFDMYRYQAEYTKNNLRRYEFRVLKEKEADIIQHLIRVGNVQNYVKNLIRKDMEENPLPDPSEKEAVPEPEPERIGQSTMQDYIDHIKKSW